MPASQPDSSTDWRRSQVRPGRLRLYTRHLGRDCGVCQLDLVTMHDHRLNFFELKTRLPIALSGIQRWLFEHIGMHVLYHPEEHLTDGLPDLRSRYYHLYCPLPSLPHEFNWDRDHRCHWLDGPFTHVNPITGWAVLASEIPFPCCGRYSSEYVEGHPMPQPIDPVMRKLTPRADPDPRVHLPALLRAMRERGVSYATLRETLALIYEIDGRPLGVDVDALLARAGISQ